MGTDVARKTMRIAIRARRLGPNVYVRKDDLLRWFDGEEALLRELGEERLAEHAASIAADIRKVRAS